MALVAAAVPIASLAVATAVFAAPSGPNVAEVEPLNAVESLDCAGEGLAIVYHADLYMPRTSEAISKLGTLAPKTPEAAIELLVADAYPAAAGTSAFKRLSPGSNVFEAKNSQGGRRALMSIEQMEDGLFTVDEVAICESLAQEWQR